MNSFGKWAMGAILISAVAACGGATAGSGGATVPTGGGGDTGGGDTGGDVGSLTIRNTSNYGIYSIQLAPYDNDDWGQNLLADDPLLPGEGGKVPVFACAKYDLRMLDDQNKECVIQDIDLCLKDEDWEINDTVLAICRTEWAD